MAFNDPFLKDLEALSESSSEESDHLIEEQDEAQLTYSKLNNDAAFQSHLEVLQSETSDQ